MTPKDTTPEQVDKLLETPDLADALESEQFKHFLDQVPIAIAVSNLSGPEQIVYANPEFRTLSGVAAATLADQGWTALSGEGLGERRGRALGETIVEQVDFAGTFRMQRSGLAPALVDVYSHIIENDQGKPNFRLVALIDVTLHEQVDREALEDRLRDKDTLLRELQHRVKNNLQMITALIRLESKHPGEPDPNAFERLAGRVNSLAILYEAMSHDDEKGEIDLGVYLSQIASAVMSSHAVEGIRLDMKVDAYPVSINVAMPTGLVVNELLTNALKHAFPDGEGGTITLRSTVDGDGCRVVVADDGVGFPEGQTWPKPGKLGALIAQSLQENADADIEVDSHAGEGTCVTIIFRRSAAAA